MVAGKFLLFLCGICAINADVMLPRRHFIDWTLFQNQVAVSSEYIWKSMWWFETAPTTGIENVYASEERYSVSGSELIRHRRFINLNTQVCSEVTDDTFPYLHQSDSVFLRTKSFPEQPDNYLAFLSSTPTKYLWVYQCIAVANGTCPESLTSIKFLYNQGETYNRPEGIPWARALKDLKQATKLTLDEVRVDNGTAWRAVYTYKKINNICM